MGYDEEIEIRELKQKTKDREKAFINLHGEMNDLQRSLNKKSKELMHMTNQRDNYKRFYEEAKDGYMRLYWEKFERECKE